MTIELATKGIVHPKCQLLGIEGGAMVYPKDKVSGIATKGIIQTRCYLVTKEEIADAVWEEPHGEHENELTFGGLMKVILKVASKVFIPIRKR